MRLFAFLLSLSLLSNCAGSIRDYIVVQRNTQGDLAYDRNNYKDAALAYRLALDLEPDDQHARTGLVSVQTQLAAIDYRASKFEEALDALAVAAKFDPQSVRVAQLKAAIEEAQLKEAIVISNYPTYRETGLQLRREFAALRKLDSAIVEALQRFDYTSDSNELADAIRQATTLTEEVTHLRARLLTYRQLVEAGTPQKGTPLPPSSSSLLPLP
jgi:tetratricopeptide (TPR) repeat protein